VVSELVGLDAELYDALAECGRIIEEMPWDERRHRVDRFMADKGLLDGVSQVARDFLIGVMVVAHQRRLYDLEARPPSSPSAPVRGE